MIVLDLSILNQKGTPMFNSDIFANRPAFGIVGRIFISIDTAAIYRDTGTAWDLIADGGSSSTNIYNSNGTLSANRVVSDGGFGLSFTPTTHIGTAAIGGGGSGKLIVGSSTADNGIQIFGANSPSLRIDNAQSGGTQRFVIGLATATNNFIQGAAAGEFCISTQSAGNMLFGMWQTTNASEVMRITTTNNLLIGSSVDTGQKLQVTGTATFSSSVSAASFNGTTNNIFSVYTIEGMRLTSVGLGIGITSFSRKLSLLVSMSSVGDNGISINNGLTDFLLTRTGSAYTYRGVPANASMIYSGTNIALLADGAFNISFHNSQEHMRLSSGGNFLIGTTTDAGQKLQVTGTATFSSTVDVSGVLAIGNSVAAAVAAPSTHKVSILINGVQYYLLASNV